MNNDYRMYILVNEDVEIKKGKLAGQVGHAVASYFWKLMKNPEEKENELLNEYMEIQKKIILYAPQSKLEELEREGHITIRDKGFTQLEPNTLTCVNIGIYDVNEVPKWVKKLKLVK